MCQVGMRSLLDGIPMCNFVVVYSGDGTSCEVGGLSPATLYEFVVIAVCPLGPSPPSAPSVLETASAPPGPCDPPFLLARGRNFLHVGWRPPNIVNGAPITCFRLECISQDQTSVLQLFQGPSLDFVLQGLAPGSSTWLRVVAANARGYGVPSPMVCLSTACSVPSAPLQVSAKAKGRTAGDIQWQLPESDGGSQLTGFRVHYARLCEKETRADAKVVTCEASPLHIDGLTAGTNYIVSVQAGNAEGFGDPSAQVILTTEAAAPAAPAPPVLEDVGLEGVRINWSPPTRDNGAPIDEYALQMHDGTHFATLYQGSLTSFEVLSLQPGATYKFRVCATNSAGQGPFSTAVTFTTRAVEPGPPLALTLTGVTHNSIKLKW
jgi:hypothetical protein